MTEAEQEWSLIEGLEYCKNKRRYDKSCAKCPYAGLGCAIDAAIVKLITQEPRLMTYNEVKKHYNLPSVFIDSLDAQEDYYQDIQPLYFEFSNPSPWDVHWRSSNQVRSYLDKWQDRYNVTWRCWTSKPTKEQREIEEWENVD